MPLLRELEIFLCRRTHYKHGAPTVLPPSMEAPYRCWTHARSCKFHTLWSARDLRIYRWFASPLLGKGRGL